MPDARQPDEPDGDPTGRVDYSNRDYSAPTGYRAPDFLSSWSRPATDAGSTPDTDDGTDVDVPVDDDRGDHEHGAPDVGTPEVETAGSPAPAPEPATASASAESDNPLGHWGAASSGDAISAEGANDRDGHPPADVGDAVAPAADEAPEGHRDAAGGRDADTDTDTDTELASSWSDGDDDEHHDDEHDDHESDDEWDEEHDGAASSDTPAWTPRSDPPEPAAPSEQPHKPRDNSILAMFFGLAALFMALISPLLMWVFVALAAVFVFLAFRQGGARRIRSLVAGGLAVAGVILFVATSFTVPGGRGAAGGTQPPLSSAPNGEPFTVTGSGDADVRFPMPDGPGTLSVVDITHESMTGNLSASELVDDGSGYSVATIYGNGTARAVINTSRFDEALGLEIEAEGDWSVRVSSVTALPTFDTTVSGEGEGDQPTFLYYDGPAGVGSLTFESPSYVHVELLGPDDGWSVYGSDYLAFSKLWPTGPLVVSIESDVAWTLDVVPGSTSPPGVDPAATPENGEPAPTDPGATDGEPEPDGTVPAEQTGEDGATEG